MCEARDLHLSNQNSNINLPTLMLVELVCIKAISKKPVEANGLLLVDE